MSLRVSRTVILPRFCGPPESGNGGYSAGLLAAALDGPAEVTLRRPPPLDRELTLLVEEGHTATMRDGELVIAEARAGAVGLEAPTAPSFESAQELSTRYVGYTKHFFPRCFVCGPERAEGDGLRIFPGQEASEQRVAAPWVPDLSVADESGRIPTAITWAALDCVGYFAVAAPDYPVALLGRMTAELTGELSAGERCVVIGWSLGREGRKLHAGTAVYDSRGVVRGVARQTWLSIR